MKYIILLSIIFNAITASMYAQGNRANIRNAAATANTGVGRSDGNLPVDTVNWKKGGNMSLNFTQTQLSNWAAGGENSLSLSSSANLFANYKMNKLIWENTAFMAYGIVKVEKRSPVKSSDEIKIGSRVGYQMAKNWYYTAAMLGRTQFAPGYRSATDTIRISNFLAPAYLFLSLGLDYKPSSRLSVSFSPAMGKATFVRSTDPVVLASSGIPQDLIDDGKKARYEFGGGIVFNLNGGYFSNTVTYSSQLELFSNYFDKPQNIDIVWDFQFRIALSKFVASTVRVNMLYSDNQKTFRKELINGNWETRERGAQLQVKEYFEIGLLFSF